LEVFDVIINKQCVADGCSSFQNIIDKTLLHFFVSINGLVHGLAVDGMFGL